MAPSRAADTFTFGTNTNPEGRTIEVDSRGFIFDGKPVLPVMGEIHFSRVPAADWRREIRKMKAGGITIVATYVFWIHHEAEEGRWDWSGNRDLHTFVRICGEEGMPVVLRIGPFCHGEVYQGGFPVWLTDKMQADPQRYRLRSLAPGFMEATQRLYSNIYAQVSNQLWKDGGPVVGIQIENECRGPWSYYMRLKEMAVRIGFDTPFYTRTGWPKLNGKEEFGHLLPLYGDYADGFWDRQLTDMPGNYAKAFLMKDTRLSDVIATEALGANQDTRMEQKDLQYPYLTCELGGGMMPSYHRRIHMTGREALPLAICKVGSGSNLPGYYMYHGGSNPYNPAHTMAECQASAATNHNDMPHISYDFQCPLGEMGQPHTVSFHETRWLHQMLADWGSELSQMGVDALSDHYARRGPFEFRCDYVRMHNEEGTASVTFRGLEWEGLHLTSSSLQPFARIGGSTQADKSAAPELYLIPVSGTRRLELTIDGRSYTLKPDHPLRMGGRTITVLSPERARSSYVIDGRLHFARHGGILYKADSTIVEEYWTITALSAEALRIEQTREAGPLRHVRMGAQKVAEQPAEADWDEALCFSLQMTDSALCADAADLFLQINYRGDCARVYADGRLVADNFWNGKPMLVRVSDLVGKRAELRVLPLGKDFPIYLQKTQREALKNAPDGILCELSGIQLLRRTTE